MGGIKEFSTADLNTISRINTVSNTIEKINGVTVSAAPAFTGLLDTYTGAAAAYSTRRLASSATNLMRIREDVGDTETDIGYDSNGDLDTAAIASHCGSANGYVVTWYDQSGNANNATQSTGTDQPQIYNGTAVITENGKPALSFDTSQIFAQLSLTTGNLNDFGVFAVGKNTGTTQSFKSIASVRATGSASTLLYKTSQISYAGTVYGTASNNTTYNLVSVYADNASSDVQGYINQSQIFSTTPTSLALTALTIANSGGVLSTYWEGTIQEVILYPSSTKSDHTGIESNINGFFSIYP